MVSITGCFLVFLLLHYRRRRESFPQTVCKTKAPSTGAFCLLGNFHSAAAEPKKRVGQNGVGDPRCTLITTIVRRELSRSTSSRSDCAVSINHTLIQYVRRSRLMVESAGCRLGPYPPYPPRLRQRLPQCPRTVAACFLGRSQFSSGLFFGRLASFTAPQELRPSL